MADDAIPTTPVTKPKDRWKTRDNPDWVSGWKDEEKKEEKGSEPVKQEFHFNPYAKYHPEEQLQGESIFAA